MRSSFMAATVHGNNLRDTDTRDAPGFTPGPHGTQNSLRESSSSVTGPWFTSRASIGTPGVACVMGLGATTYIFASVPELFSSLTTFYPASHSCRYVKTPFYDAEIAVSILDEAKLSGRDYSIPARTLRMRAVPLPRL